MYTEPISKLLGFFPIPLIAAVAILVLGSWIIKEVMNFSNYGPVFKSKAFKILLVVESSVVTLFLILTLLFKVLSNETFGDGKIGVIICKIEDADGKNFSNAVFHSLKSLVTSEAGYENISFIKIDDKVDDLISAAEALQRHNAKILICGNILDKNTAFIDFFHLHSSSSIPVRIFDFPSIDGLKSDFKNLLNSYLTNEFQLKKLESENFSLRKTIDSLRSIVTAYSEIKIDESNVKDINTVKSKFRLKKKHILSIGLNKLNDFKTASLIYAESDAKNVASLLSSSYTNASVRTLIGNQATKSNILSSLREINSEAAKDDLIVLYISGHGYYIGGKYYLLPFDYRSGSPAETAILGDDINKIFRELKGEFKAFIIDACYAGGLPGIAIRGVEQPTIEMLIRDYLRPSTLYMTSSQRDGVAYESSEFNGGLFTHFLMEGIRGQADSNKDGIITGYETFEFIQDNMLSSDYKQYPTFSNVEGFGNLILNVSDSLKVRKSIR